jgi:molybdate transport system substrate-binding protein
MVLYARSRRTVLLMLLVSAVSLCSASVNAASLRIAAASSLQFALNEIIDDYQQVHDNLNVQAVYGSSGNLYRQIVQGAPFDLFLSADASLVDKLHEAGVTHDAGVTFGKGQLVLAVSQRVAEPGNAEKSSADEVLAGLQAQSEPFRLAIANPAHAPYGKAAKQYLQSIQQWGNVKSSLVYGEKVSQATQYVSSGAADAGIISLSLAQALNLRYALIDHHHYQPILHKMTRLSEKAQAADLYMHLSTSESVAAVFEKYGYLTTRQ